MSFVRANCPPIQAIPGFLDGEETKTNPCWQCDHTERASSGLYMGKPCRIAARGLSERYIDDGMIFIRKDSVKELMRLQA